MSTNLSGASTSSSPQLDVTIYNAFPFTAEPFRDPFCTRSFSSQTFALDPPPSSSTRLRSSAPRMFYVADDVYPECIPVCKLREKVRRAKNSTLSTRNPQSNEKSRLSLYNLLDKNIIFMYQYAIAFIQLIWQKDGHWANIFNDIYLISDWLLYSICIPCYNANYSKKI